MAFTTNREMGYTGLYSLGARCGSEAIATGLMIFLGEGTLANELLNKTKGHNMGFGWVRLMRLLQPVYAMTSLRDSVKKVAL